MQTKSDTELLRDYAANKSEAAFGEIVRRYVARLRQEQASLSAVSESVPPGNEMNGFKMYHLEGCLRAAH